MKNLTIQQQLMLLSGVLLAFLIASGLVGIQMVRNADDDIRSLYEDRVVPLKQLKAISDAYAVDIVDTAHKTRDGTLSPNDAQQAISKAKHHIQTQFEAYTATQLVAQEKTLLNQLRPLLVRANASVDSKRPPNALLARGWIQVQAVVGAAGCQRWGSREEMSACLVVGRRVMTSRRYA